MVKGWETASNNTSNYVTSLIRRKRLFPNPPKTQKRRSVGIKMNRKEKSELKDMFLNWRSILFWTGCFNICSLAGALFFYINDNEYLIAFLVVLIVINAVLYFGCAIAVGAGIKEDFGSVE